MAIVREVLVSVGDREVITAIVDNGIEELAPPDGDGERAIYYRILELEIHAPRGQTVDVAMLKGVVSLLRESVDKDGLFNKMLAVAERVSLQSVSIGATFGSN